MGLFDRTLGSLRAQKADNPALAMITPAGVAAFPNLRYETFVREGYMKNPMVFACFPAETPIAIAGARIKPIAEIAVGDRVRTHTGATSEVVAVGVRPELFGVYEISRVGDSQKIMVTAEHPLWVAKHVDNRMTDAQPTWVKVRDLRRRDFLSEAIPTFVRNRKQTAVFPFVKGGGKRKSKYEGSIDVNADLMRLVGYFLAEGWVNGNGIRFCFATHEHSYHDDVDDLMRRFFGVERHTYPGSSEGSIIMGFGSVAAAAFFRQFGHRARGKFIPEWVMDLPPRKQLGLLLGFWRGDGCGGYDSFIFDTASTDLAEGLRVLLLRQKIAPNVHRKMRERGMMHRVGISGGHAHRFAKLIGLPAPTCGHRNAARVVGNQAFYAIRNIKFVESQLPVYNFEVKGDHSYVAAGIAAHNCIEEWATDIAEAELKVWRDGKDGPEEVEDHPAMQVFREPNPYLSGDDLLGGIELYKRLAGNAYEYKVRSNGQKTLQRWLLRPDRVTIVPDKQRYIARYEYRIGAEKFDLDPRDVVHHKTRNPYDDYYGMPPLMPASGYTDIANFMADMIKGFLNSTGMPAGILQVAGKVTEGERALIRQRFRSEFGGTNTGNIMIADGANEAPKFTPLSMPLGARGLVVPELDEIQEARICAVFRVPLSLAGARLAQVHSTLGAGGREADYQFFIKQQLVPEWKSVASTETMAGRGDYLEDGEYFMFDLSGVTALNEDENSRASRVVQEYQGLIRSIQEARTERGLPADPKPDDLFAVPINITMTKWADIIAPPEPVQLPPVAVPASNPDQLPTTQKPPELPQQKQLGEGRPLVVNVIGSGKVRKEFEYDTDGNLIASNESPVE